MFPLVGGVGSLWWTSLRLEASEIIYFLDRWSWLIMSGWYGYYYYIYLYTASSKFVIVGLSHGHFYNNGITWSIVMPCAIVLMMISDYFYFLQLCQIGAVTIPMFSGRARVYKSRGPLFYLGQPRIFIELNISWTSQWHLSMAKHFFLG